MTGDLTDGGIAPEWIKFVAHWGLTGKEGLVKYPVYEGAGNHDGAPSSSTKEGRGHARRQIILRNNDRVGVVNKSENGLHYSWDWDDIHFVQLNEYAGLEDAERYPGNADYGRKIQNYGCPAEKSLQFLRADLKSQVGDSGRPVILAQHYGFVGFPLTPWGEAAAWWTEEHALRLWETIEGYNVMCILAGHDGSENAFDWHGIPTRLMDDAIRFGVYRITDDKMTVAKRNSKSGKWENTWSQSTDINASMPQELIEGPYLTYPGEPGKMTVHWRTGSNIPCILKWDDHQFLYKKGSVEVKPYDEKLHIYKHTITDLKPNSSVNYTLDISGKYAPGMFYSAPAGQDKVKFLITSGEKDGKKREQLFKTIYDKLYEDAAYHSILLHTGDLQDQETFSRKPNVRYARYMASRTPMMTPGNGSEKDYDSFDYGPLHVAALKTEAGKAPTSDQLAWLKNDLTSTKSAWKLVTWKKENTNRKIIDAIAAICSEEKIEVFLSNGDILMRVEKTGVMAIMATPHNIGAGWSTAMIAIQIEGDKMTGESLDLEGATLESFNYNPNQPR